MSEDKNLQNLIAELIEEGAIDEDSLAVAKLLNPNSTKDNQIPIMLNNYFEFMNSTQLQKVAKRFNPTAKANRMEDCKKAIKTALATPKLLDNMIARLSKLEHEILVEAKSLGGQVNGWTLIIFAAVHGFKAKPVQMQDVYKRSLLQTKAVGLIAALLRDGLLLPSNNYASWFTIYSYLTDDNKNSDDLLTVDPRILERLPSKTTLAAPKKLPLKKASSTLSTQHPAQILLEFNEVLSLVQEQGGLQVTKAGVIAKTAVNRLIKARPWLETNLEHILAIIMEMGFFQDVSESKSNSFLKVNLNYLNQFQIMPLAARYATIIESFLYSTNIEQEKHIWRQDSYYLTSLPIARRALLESLILLPQHPVLLSDAITALWQQVLHYVKKKDTFYDEDKLEDIPTWFSKTLIGIFNNLGLIAVAKTVTKAKPASKKGTVTVGKIINGKLVLTDVSEGKIDNSQYVVMPTLGYEWYQQGKKLQFNQESNQESNQENNQENNKSETAANIDIGSKVYELIDLSSQASDSKEKALLVQANYDILVYLDKLSPLAILALSCADCTGIDNQIATYKLSRTSIYRSLEAGLKIEQVLGLLEKNSSSLPTNVIKSLQEWSSKREKLSFYQNICLLEYSSKAKRDQALKKLKSGRVVAERFIVTQELPKGLKCSSKHNYQAPTAPIINFNSDGSFTLDEHSDLAGRAVLSTFTRLNEDGNYQFDTQVIAQGGFTNAIYEALEERTYGNLPDYVKATINIWQNQSALPAIARVSLFQHEYATALAKHPEVSKYLTEQLGENIFLIKQDCEKDLESALKSLGIITKNHIDPLPKAKIKASVEQKSRLQTGLVTRKMREMIESAIAQSRWLELRYNPEKIKYNRYGYSEKVKGKAVTETIKPEKVKYYASIPYFRGITKEKEKRHIRIGYIQGIAVLSAQA